MRLLNQMFNLSRSFDRFSRRFDKVLFNLKLSNLVDSDVPSQSSYTSRTDSFPVAPEAVLTGTHCIKGRPHENRELFYLSFALPSLPRDPDIISPSLSLPLKNK